MQVFKILGVGYYPLGHATEAVHVITFGLRMYSMHVHVALAPTSAALRTIG